MGRVAVVHRHGIYLRAYAGSTQPGIAADRFAREIAAFGSVLSRFTPVQGRLARDRFAPGAHGG